MAKTVAQIIDLAETLAEGIIIADADAILWINEFLSNKLRDKAMIQDSEDYSNSAAYTEYTLPADFESVYKIEQYLSPSLLLTEYNGEYHDYELSDTKVYFKDDGNFKLQYLKLPTEVTKTTDSVSIDSCFYEPCTLWVAFRALTQDDEDNAKEQSLGVFRYREYLTAMNDAITHRKKRIKSPSSHHIRRVM